MAGGFSFLGQKFRENFSFEIDFCPKKPTLDYTPPDHLAAHSNAM